MKKVTAILSLMLMSSTVFADDCVSINLSREKERLSSTQGLSEAERSILYNMSENLKVSQILTCTGLRESVSESDSLFAIRFIDSDRASKIASIVKEEEQLKNLLQDSTISGVEREIYIQALGLIPKRINQENELANTIIKHIKRATK